MKKILFIALLFIISSTKIYSCDICGCNSGSYFIGPFPQFSRNFAGIRYSFEKYATVLSSDQTQFSNDFYQTTELMAGTNIKNRLQLLLFVPYNTMHSKSDDGINHNNGFGDMTFMGNYNLLSKKYLNRDTVTVFQQLWLGAGVKVPTGKFAVDTGELVASANNQLGTGSFDYMLNLIYSFQIKSWGFNVNTNYRINRPADHYKFGNRLNLTAFAFRNFHIGKFILSPNAGVLYNHLNPNKNRQEKVADTGGNILLAATGIEFRYNNLVFGLNDQIPLSSNLSSGQTEAKIRGMCHLTIMF